MSDFPPALRRRSRSEIETYRRSLHEERHDDHDFDDDEDEENGGFRRRVVSFTCPPGGSLTYLHGGEETNNTCAAHLELQKSESGEDTPDGLFRKADTSRDEKGGSGNVGGFRRRLKSFSIGLSLSPGSSTHDVRTAGQEGAAGGGAAAGGAQAGGRMVSSLVRQSLLQAAWPLSVSLEDIEAHQKPGHQHQQERARCRRW